MDEHRNPDGTYDGFGSMSAVTGLPHSELRRLAESARANHERLRSCARHEFEPVLPMVPMRQWYRCRNCGGEVDAHAYYWHEQGRRSAQHPIAHQVVTPETPL